MLVNPRLTPSQSEFLKDSYEVSGHVSLENATQEQREAAQWLTQNYFLKRVAPAEYVLLLKGWEYVERNQLVDKKLLENTHKIREGSLELRRHPQDVRQWREEMHALGIGDLTINRIQNSLLLADLL